MLVSFTYSILSNLQIILDYSRGVLYIWKLHLRLIAQLKGRKVNNRREHFRMRIACTKILWCHCFDNACK